MPSDIASRFKGKKVLVTGGLGFIGSNLALRLVGAGAEVTVIDCLSPECGGNAFNIDPARSQIKVLALDLADKEALLGSGALSPELDFVFCLAAKISHSESMSDPLSDLNMNVLAELTLLEGIRKYCPRVRVVHTGTRQVFGRPLYSPVDENHPIQPTDINGIHKYCVEEYHRIYHRVHGLRTTILRLTNTYGPRQLIRRSSQGVAGNFIGQALRGEVISVFGGGAQTRDFNFISDTVNALLLAASTEECVGETYNLSGFNYSLRAFLDFLGNEEKVQTQNIQFPPEQAKIDIGNFSASSEKFQKATGWEPEVDLEQGIAETMRFFRANGKNYL